MNADILARRPSASCGPEQVQQRTPLFDHLVGADKQCWRHCKAEGLGGPEIDCLLKFDRYLDGKLTRVCAAQNAINIEGGTAKYIDVVRPIGK